MLLKLCRYAEGPSRSMEVSKNAALRCCNQRPSAIDLLVLLRLLKTACVVVEKDIFPPLGMHDGQADG